MTPLQELEIKETELRGKIAEMMAMETRSADDMAILDTVSKDMATLQIEKRAAIVLESTSPTSIPVATQTTEQREVMGLLKRANLGAFISEVANEIPMNGGAEMELRAALLGNENNRPGKVPIEMLIPPNRLETRADAATTVDAAALADGSQAPILPRVFTKTIAAMMGVDMPSVPVGAANYPIMLTGTTAAQRAAGIRHDATVATFTGETLEPTRLTARYLFRVEDAAKLPNYEATLRMDLDAAISDQMDDQTINGSGAAPNVNGFISELPANNAGAAETTWNEHLADFTDRVDGINAYELMDLRSVISKQAFTYLETLFRTGATDNGPRASACEYVKSRTGSQMVSSRMPHASNVSTGLIALSSYPGRNAVAPIWSSFDLIRDPYSRAAEGEVAMTAIVLWNFKILREAGWNLFQTRVAV